MAGITVVVSIHGSKGDMVLFIFLHAVEQEYVKMIILFKVKIDSANTTLLANIGEPTSSHTEGKKD